MGLDDLRSAAFEDEDEGLDVAQFVSAGDAGDERLFGMTAVERMFVSMGCFVVTSLFGFVLLLVLDKIAI